LAGLPKFVDGGWLPIAISIVLSTIALTWHEGRRRLFASPTAKLTPVNETLDLFQETANAASGTMVFLTPDFDSVPFLARHRWVRSRAREEHLVTLHLKPVRTPYIEENERVKIERLAPRFVRVEAHFGYMEALSLEPVLHACAAQGLRIDDDETSFFYAAPKIVAQPGGFPAWRRWLFVTLYRNSRPLPDDLHILAERRIELGVTVAL
jgi:KUP system potassium uptake protein